MWGIASAGGEHTEVLKTDGILWSCGRNEYGQLGDGSLLNKTLFVSIACPTSLSTTTHLIGSGIQAYPNPIKDILSLSYENEITMVTIYTTLGQEVFSTSFNAKEGTLDTTSLASGVYMIKVATPNEVLTLKVVKE